MEDPDLQLPPQTVATPSRIGSGVASARPAFATSTSSLPPSPQPSALRPASASAAATSSSSIPSLVRGDSTLRAAREHMQSAAGQEKLAAMEQRVETTVFQLMQAMQDLRRDMIEKVRDEVKVGLT